MLQTPQCPKNPVLATFLEHNKNMGDLSNICLEPSTLDSETPYDTASRDDLNPEPASFPIALVDNGLAREMLVPPAEPGRSIRVRVAPTRFDANPKRKRVRTFTPEQKVQYDTNSVLREQMRYNDDTIWKNAIAFSCPLLRAHKIEAGDFEENDLLSLLGTQMRQVAVADDGHQYDFGAIKAYIQANIDRQLVSPITKEPMTCSVRYTGPVRAKDGTLRKTLVVSTWRPDLITGVDA